jgi:hypothetical protein
MNWKGVSQSEFDATAGRGAGVSLVGARDNENGDGAQTFQPAEEVACNPAVSFESSLSIPQTAEIGALRAIWPASRRCLAAAGGFSTRLEGL